MSREERNLIDALPQQNIGVAIKGQDCEQSCGSCNSCACGDNSCGSCSSCADCGCNCSNREGNITK